MRKLLSLFILAAIITALCGSAAADQSTPENAPATLKEVNVVVNGSGNTTQMFAYELNTLLYFRVQDICQAVDFDVTSNTLTKIARINTFKGYGSGGVLPEQNKKSIEVNPEKAQIYCDDLMYTSYHSFTVDGVLYVSINDIVNATSNAADLMDKPDSAQPPRIIWLGSDNPAPADFTVPSAVVTCRYLTFNYDYATNVLSLSVVVKQGISINVGPPLPADSGGKQWLPIYPLQSQPTLLSPGK